MQTYPSLKDRVVIVTGGGRGLGQVMALALIGQGARVMITASRAPSDLEETRAAAEALAPGALRVMTADVTDADADEAVAQATLQAFGRIDVLINNAARPSFESAKPRADGLRPKFWEADLNGYRTMVDTNLVGPFVMTRAVMPAMLAQGFGKIINISTSRPTMVLQGIGPYGACKAGLETSSVMWARDLDGSGVTVNVLLPGGGADTALIPGGQVGTRAAPGFQPGKASPGQEGRLLDGGLLPPSVMAAPALWLCSDESNAFNGRRLIGRDWDPDLPANEAAARAMQPRSDAPTIM